MSSLLKKAGLIFDENKTKPFLKMSIQRLSLLINKKTNHIKIAKKEIARLLSEGKEEKARIRVEQVIREDFTIQAYDVLELHCELVAERMRFVASQPECPPDMEQAICTIIWAADRSEVTELSTVKSQMSKKYGAEWVKRAENNEDGCVNDKVIEKLACEPPSGYLVTDYLKAIAEEYGVDYVPVEPMQQRGGSSAATNSSASGSQPSNNSSKHNNSDGNGGGGGGGGGGVADAGEQGPQHPCRGSADIAGPPPVTAWAVPSTEMPQAHVTLSPQPSWASHQGEGGASAAGIGIPDGIGPPPGYAKAEHVDPVGASHAPRKPSRGWDDATKGWGPEEGVKVEEKKEDELKVPDDPPPAYTRYAYNDIPSPPTTRPTAPSPSLDIPAAPGYEDSPPQETGRGRPSTSGDESCKDDDCTPQPDGDGTTLDDIATRFSMLRKS